MNAATMPLDTTLPLDVRLLQWAARWMTMISAGVLVLLAVAWLLRQPWFAFGRILLEGELNRSSVATVRANAVPQLKGNFFTLDLNAARRAFESVPWVRSAEIRRAWPNVLRVSLQEHRAVALWQDTESRGRPAEDRLVGLDGSVFQANPGDVEDQNLPLFRGPEGSSAAMLNLYRRLEKTLAPIGQLAGNAAEAGIRVLQLSSRGSWSVELDTGARLEIGRGDEDAIVARCAQFVHSLPQAIAPYRSPLVYADLRHPAGYALRLAGVTTAPSAASPAAATRKKP